MYHYIQQYCNNIDSFFNYYTSYFDNIELFKLKTNNSYHLFKHKVKSFITPLTTSITFLTICKTISHIKSKFIKSHPIF